MMSNLKSNREIVLGIEGKKRYDICRLQFLKP